MISISKNRMWFCGTDARHLVRSPHYVEVLLSYGLGFVLYSAVCLFVHQIPLAQFFTLVGFGLCLYTFLEYWFHRQLLHSLLQSIHANHHREPSKLRIIMTPIFPVHLTDVVVVGALIVLLGRQIACGLNCGIALGQMIMDTTHVLFHAPNSPWLLRYARSYHLWHHYSTAHSTGSDSASRGDDYFGHTGNNNNNNTQQHHTHGLTTPFWDMIFGTLPNKWPVYARYPKLRYLQVPFPLLSFVMIAVILWWSTPPAPMSTPTPTRSTPSAAASSTSASTLTSTSTSTSRWWDVAFGPVQVRYLITSCLGACLAFPLVY
eukprot:TRINITY_DN3748_c0_g1_i1.p1 TRINITY_DN3748_c0_g1~~TRINITY_DN3748_c0_g1_i1.p1  ORF type:complete len:318 (+),score=28.98 TRINITY_DN3748_c0_g1_i1:54-1007(+)